MQRIVVLAGRGRYEDPWHDHAATSHRVALVLSDLAATGSGVDIEVRGLFPESLHDLRPDDVLVVNAGRLRPDPDADVDGDERRWAPFHELLVSFARAGGGVLALHQAANTFSDNSSWESVLGGRWVEGRSYHPPLDQATIQVRHTHPITAGLVDFEVLDERYCLLRTSDHVQVLATQREAGADHPVAWVNQHEGYRCVYDGLGHDVRSLDSAGRRELLLREARWLLDGADA